MTDDITTGKGAAYLKVMMKYYSPFNAGDYLNTKEAVSEYVKETSERITCLETALREIVSISDCAVTDSLETSIRWDEAIDAARAALEKKDD